ncbi:MAG TPA: hypothetical protein VFE47_17285 [Tepidisphaeraceae bacterium]|nr:hypothetical protein [Tepidisphaeraceae bacterium]
MNRIVWVLLCSALSIGASSCTCAADLHGDYAGRFRSQLTAAVVHFYDANQRWPSSDELKVAFNNETTRIHGDTPRFERLETDIHRPTGEFLAAYDAVAVRICDTRAHGIISVAPFPKGHPPEIPRYIE